MKRFVSAVIAGAMVLSMSVASFASKEEVTFGETPKAVVEREDSVSDIELNYVKILRNGELVNKGTEIETKNAKVIAGDILYFAMNKEGTTENVKGEPDKDWRIKVSNASHIESVEFFYDKDMKVGTVEDTLWVKVEISDDFNSYEKDKMNVWFYLYDIDTKAESTRVKVGFDYADYNEVELTKEDVKHIVPLEFNTIYTIDEKSTSKMVVFNYEDMYLMVHMFAGEEYIVNSLTKEFNKTLTRKFDANIEVVEINSNIDEYDIFFESRKDDKIIYEVVDEKLVKVDSVYEDKYEIIKDEYILTEGYMVEDAEDNQWVILDEDIKVEVKTETEVEDIKPSTDKTNPSTGAGDVVSMASAMAVMAIVAGAGLMISKK